ncbi:MAG: hypothetical protein HOP29_19600 [Phycisphaerales bacterium]|nr:hypothetical protein [Phycisphaerales bacterium]
MTRNRLPRVVGGVALLAVTGCPGPRPMPTFMTRDDALAVVNGNLNRLRGGLRARGDASGHFTDQDGRRRSFQLSAKLLVVPPDRLHLQLEHPLAGDELRLGTNGAKWWLWLRRPEPHLVELTRGETAEAVGHVPIQADQLLGAIGLLPLTGAAAQRITEDHQQIIFFATGTDGNGDAVLITKEFWLDRYDPWLIGEVVYRDEQGRELFRSDLKRYRLAVNGDLMLPHEIVLHWPMNDAEMTLSIDRWVQDEALSGDALPFVAPSDRPPMTGG